VAEEIVRRWHDVNIGVARCYGDNSAR